MVMLLAVSAIPTVEYVKVTHLDYSALDPRLIFIKKKQTNTIKNNVKISLKQLMISPGSALRSKLYEVTAKT